MFLTWFFGFLSGASALASIVSFAQNEPKWGIVLAMCFACSIGATILHHLKETHND